MRTAAFVWIVLLLSACAAPAPPPEAPEPTAEPQIDAAAAPESEPAAEDDAPASEPAPALTEEGLLADPGTLGSLVQTVTRTWNTDFTRSTVPFDEIIGGGPLRDGIPSIDAPQFISVGAAEEWLAPTEPVILVEREGEAKAYPLQILTRHEIVNDEIGGLPVAVTFCPLCNSALVFDRRVNGEVYEFGVSGLLRNSDLLMYDRTTESLWQQFTGQGVVGFHAGDQLDFIGSQLISFETFAQAYPQGQVLSRETGIYPEWSYGQNPYVGYDSSPRPFLFDGELDDRLPALERVVGLNLNGEQVAYPYPLLAERSAINDEVGGQPVVIFHQFGTNSALGEAEISQAEDVGATGVFIPQVEGQALTFSAEDGVITDAETGSTWNLLGQAIEGPLAGSRLEPVLSTDHFWFSWAAFYPQTAVYEEGQ